MAGVLTSASLFALAACGGSSSSHTSNADACRAVVADLHKVATAFSTITTKPSAFASAEPALEKSLIAHVQGVAKGDLQPAVNDFAAHLKAVGQAVGKGKPPSATDATAFGVDAQKIDTVCRAAGVPSTS